MLRTNVIIFAEEGSVYFGYTFNPSYLRVVMLAFRLKDSTLKDRSNNNRNHYDSLLKLGEDSIIRCSEILISDQMKSSAMGEKPAKSLT